MPNHYGGTQGSRKLAKMPRWPRPHQRDVMRFGIAAGLPGHRPFPICLAPDARARLAGLPRLGSTPRKPPRGMAAPAAISARLFAGKRRPGEVGISSDCFLKATVSGSVIFLEDQRWFREPPFKAQAAHRRRATSSLAFSGYPVGNDRILSGLARHCGL